MTLQDSCDTLYKSTRKLVFKIEENRCAVTGAAVLGGENKNTDRAEAQSVFLTGMVDLPLRGINLDSTYLHPKKYPRRSNDRREYLVGDGGFTPAGHKPRLHLSPPNKKYQPPDGDRYFLVGDGGFEPPKALPADLQSVPFGHSGNPPYMKFGAGGRIRTPDLLITNQLLYQLSYTSISISAVYSNRTFWVCQHIFYARNEGE